MPENPLTLRLGNALYSHAFWMYRPCYTAYKHWTDRHERNLMRRVVRPGMTVVDIGANIGVHVGLLADLVGPSGRVVAFEPHPANYRRLEAAAKNAAPVETVQAAISHETGSLTLFESDELNVDHRTYDPGGKRHGLTVPSYRLDDYLDDDVRVDFIKMDIQGAEWFALRGMEEVLRRSSGVQLLFEFWPHALEQAAGDMLKPVHFLEERGFRIEALKGEARVPFEPGSIPDGPSDFCNLYAARPAE